MAPKSLSQLSAPAKRRLVADATLVAKTAASAEIRRKAARIARAESPDFSALAEGLPDAAALDDVAAIPVEEDTEEDVIAADDDDEALRRGTPATSSDIEEGLDDGGGNGDEDDDAGALGIRVQEVSQFKTPTKKRARAPPSEDSEDEAPPRKMGYKVVSGEFTPRTRRLGAVSKKSLRAETVMVNPYPGTTSRFAAVYNVVRKTALESRFSTAETRATFERIETGDPVTKDRFITFVGYTRGLLMNTVIKKARGELGAFGIPGNYTAQALQDKISWLYKTEAYKFGGLNVATESFDAQQPFCAEFFANLARANFLETRGNGDSEIFSRVMDCQAVPKTMNALFMTAIEHALLEWREGTHKITDFKEDAGARYMYHLGGWERLEQQAPRYALKVQQDLFKKILTQSNKLFLLDSTLDAGAMNNLDFAGLEASVAAASV